MFAISTTAIGEFPALNRFITAVTDKDWPGQKQIENCDESLDHFSFRDGEIFAGTHLLVDLWEAKDINCLERMETALKSCVDKCNATLLHIHLHQFSSSGGISGVAVLAESHISVHTWPEKNYAAFDVFMCGDSYPHRAIKVLCHYFRPGHHELIEKRRGRIR